MAVCLQPRLVFLAEQCSKLLPPFPFPLGGPQRPSAPCISVPDSAFSVGAQIPQGTIGKAARGSNQTFSPPAGEFQLFQLFHVFLILRPFFFLPKYKRRGRTLLFCTCENHSALGLGGGNHSALGLGGGRRPGDIALEGCSVRL